LALAWAIYANSQSPPKKIQEIGRKSKKNAVKFDFSLKGDDFSSFCLAEIKQLC
jgi:hypothetical protein